jgi:hypothetical protein
VFTYTLPVPGDDDDDDDDDERNNLDGDETEDDHYYDALKALRPYRQLQPKKVAVIVDFINTDEHEEHDANNKEDISLLESYGIICASVLSKDGHDVTIFQQASTQQQQQLQLQKHQKHQNANNTKEEEIQPYNTQPTDSLLPGQRRGRRTGANCSGTSGFYKRTG